MNQAIQLLIVLGCITIFLACEQPKSKELPIYGNRDTVERMVDGEKVVDTVYHMLPDFHFIDQDSNSITQETFKDKIYIADFFFTSCPTICPKVKAQMLRVYNKFLDNDELILLSHSIDTKYDTVPVLKKFAEKLQIKTEKWHLVTGVKKDIYAMAKEYFIAAAEDETAPGGYTHSGGLVLVDKKRQVRGVYDGTEPEQVDQLLVDLEKLLKK